MRWLALAVLLAGCEKLFPLVPPDAAIDAAPIDAPTCDVLANYEITLIGEDKNHRYHQVLDVKTWPEAEAACESDHPKSHLFAPDSSVELAAIRNRTTANMAFHIGVARSGLSTIDDFRTITGHPVPTDDPRWSFGEPNDSAGTNTELVTQMDIGASPAGLSDINDSVLLPYICECDAEGPMPF